MLCPARPRAGQQLDPGMAPARWVMPPGSLLWWGSCLPAAGSAWQRLPAAPSGRHPPCSPSSLLCPPVSWHGGFASALRCCLGKHPAPGGGSRAPGGAWPARHPPLALLSPDALWARRGPCRASCGAAGHPPPPAAWCHRCLPRRDSITALPVAGHAVGRPCPGRWVGVPAWHPPRSHSSRHTAMDSGAPAAAALHMGFGAQSTPQIYSLRWGVPG